MLRRVRGWCCNILAVLEGFGTAVKKPAPEGLLAGADGASTAQYGNNMGYAGGWRLSGLAQCAAAGGSFNAMLQIHTLDAMTC